MKRVLIRPTFQDWCGNRLFMHGTSWQGQYRGAFFAWKKNAAVAGIKLDTWDQAPLDACDLFWMLDLPPCRTEFNRIRARLRPGTPVVLQIFESPLIAPHALIRENQTDVSAVVTYEHPDKICKRPQHYYYRLPVEVRWPAKNPPFSERKGVLMLYSNRVQGFWAIRQSGLAGLPFFGRMLAGWKCPISLLAELSRGDLYAERRAFAREAEKRLPDFLDIFGHGWNGERISWSPHYSNRPYRCWRGEARISKQELCADYRFVMAFENFRGRRGYLSEKLFDALQAGAVPVYLGEERISEIIPPESFVDARAFRTRQKLFTYLKSCPESEWLAMREAGQRFLCSEAVQPFSDQAFAETMTAILKKILVEERHASARPANYAL